MNSGPLGSLLLVVVGAGIAVLWYRGYFSDQITKATSAMTGPVAKQPFSVNVAGGPAAKSPFQLF
jgi:hypothetical protein